LCGNDDYKLVTEFPYVSKLHWQIYKFLLPILKDQYKELVSIVEKKPDVSMLMVG
jgi:hypothetical protein